MAMTFEECLQAICKEILPSSEGFASHIEDINQICFQLVEKMMEHNVGFKIVLYDLRATENNLIDLKENVFISDDIDLYMKIIPPFPIAIYEDLSQPGLIILTTPMGSSHTLIDQNRVSRQFLQNWMRNILLHIIGDGIRLQIHGRLYKIEYPRYGRGYDIAHTIIAKEIHYGKRDISIDLIPAFEIGTQNGTPLFAIPFGKKVPKDNKEYTDEFGFMICDAYREYMVLHDKKNLRDSLCLLKSICDVKSLNLITNSLLKCVYLDEIRIRSSDFWEQTLGIILIEMLEVLMQSLRHKRLHFFHDKRFKNLKLLRYELFHAYPIQLKMLLKNFRHFQKRAKVNVLDIAAFSCARSNRGRY